MGNQVKVGVGLALQAEALATSVTATIGMRGSGKSTTAGVIAEGLMDAGIQVVVVDPVGVWFGLRLARDGKAPSRFKIPVIGGAHGDITLNPGGGRQVAEALAASKSSAVLDVSMMRKGERVRFCADFAEAFLEAKKRAPAAVSLVLEEAQDVVPQLVRFSSPDASRCLGAFEDIVSVGRNFGIGLVLISQRPQKLNKEALNLSETLFAFRMTGVLERKAVQEWVREKDVKGREDVSGELPSIPRGEAIVWSPGLFELYGRHKLNPKTTYDASATPGAGRAAVQTKPLDLEQLGAAMAKVAEDAKANDPRALKARVAELEESLSRALKREASGQARVARSPKVVEKRVLSESEIKRLEAAVGRSETTAQALREAAETVKTALYLRTNVESPVPTITQKVRLAPDVFYEPVTVTFGANGTPRSGASADKGGAARMLRALAETLNDGLSRRELGALSVMKASSGTFGTYLSRLRQDGLIEDGGAGIRITEKGRAQVGPVERRTGADLLRYWVPQLGEKPGGMLTVLFESSTPIERDALADTVGLAHTSGTFGTYLSRLMSRGLIDKVGRAYTVSAAFRQ